MLLTIRGGYLYVSDQLGILSLSEQPEGEGSSEASIMAESQDKVGLRLGCNLRGKNA